MTEKLGVLVEGRRDQVLGLADHTDALRRGARPRRQASSSRRCSARRTGRRSSAVSCTRSPTAAAAAPPAPRRPPPRRRQVERTAPRRPRGGAQRLGSVGARGSRRRCRAPWRRRPRQVRAGGSTVDSLVAVTPGSVARTPGPPRRVRVGPLSSSCTRPRRTPPLRPAAGCDPELVVGVCRSAAPITPVSTRAPATPTRTERNRYAPMLRRSRARTRTARPSAARSSAVMMACAAGRR